MSNAAAQQRRAFWLKHLHQWHWVSASICLVAMLLFSITGITLNHAAQIAAKPSVSTRQREAACAVARAARRLLLAKSDEGAAAAAFVSEWISDNMGLETASRMAEWSEDEVYVSMPRPGGDAWLSIDRVSGEVHYERTDRGVVSYLNDLHKGRNAGPLWGWFIDIFAVACVLFASTGLLLLKMHSTPAAGHLAVCGAGCGGAGRGRHSVRSLTSRSLTLKKVGFMRALICSCLLALPLALTAQAAVASELSVAVEVPRLDTAEYHRPYVAVWIEREDQTVAANLSVWYEVQQSARKAPSGSRTCASGGVVAAAIRPSRSMASPAPRSRSARIS